MRHQNDYIDDRITPLEHNSAQEWRDLDHLEWYDPFLDEEQALIIEAYALIARGVARDVHF